MLANAEDPGRSCRVSAVVCRWPGYLLVLMVSQLMARDRGLAVVALPGVPPGASLEPGIPSTDKARLRCTPHSSAKTKRVRNPLKWL